MKEIRFAIIDTNILTAIGLQTILEDMIPMSEVSLVQSFEQMKQIAESETFVHFFVSSRIYFEHAQYFREHATKSIVLVNGDMQISGVYTLNVCQSEQKIVRDILSLRNHSHRQGHGHGHAMTHPVNGKPSQHGMSPPGDRQPTGILTSREVEVAILLSKGLINKEVADQLNISLTTVISHRKNIMDKLHARSLADIIIYTVMNGIVDVSEL